MRATLSFGNDFLTPFPMADGRRFDDSGFTNDLGVRCEWEGGAFDARHRMLTERGGMHRVDQVDAGLTFNRSAVVGRLRLTAEAGAAIALSGPLGGARLQDAFHYVVKGRHLGSGLQDREPDRVLAGLVLSAAVSADVAVAPWLRVGSTARGSVALGETGLSAASADLHATLTLGPVDAEAKVTARAIHSADPSLSMAGGYRSGLTPSLTLGVTAGPVRVGFTAVVNEGGSGGNMGVVSLGVKL